MIYGVATLHASEAGEMEGRKEVKREGGEKCQIFMLMYVGIMKAITKRV